MYDPFYRIPNRLERNPVSQLGSFAAGTLGRVVARNVSFTEADKTQLVEHAKAEKQYAIR